jgi:hypothetical protein
MTQPARPRQIISVQASVAARGRMRARGCTVLHLGAAPLFKRSVSLRGPMR